MAITSISAPVAVPAHALAELNATVLGLISLFNIFAGDGDPQVGDFLYPQADAIDEWLGITWDEDAHLTDPRWLTIQARSQELLAEMLDGIVADPEECLMPATQTRSQLAAAADHAREVAEKYRADARSAEAVA
jgi:hypothetical protein